MFVYVYAYCVLVCGCVGVVTKTVFTENVQ